MENNTWDILQKFRHSIYLCQLRNHKRPAKWKLIEHLENIEQYQKIHPWPLLTFYCESLSCRSIKTFLCIHKKASRYFKVFIGYIHVNLEKIILRYQLLMAQGVFCSHGNNFVRAHEQLISLLQNCKDCLLVSRQCTIYQFNGTNFIRVEKNIWQTYLHPITVL